MKNDKSKQNGKAMPSKPTGAVQVEMISPAIATEYLLKNSNNRPMNPRHVDYLCKEINKGAWEMTTDAIGFSKSGRLINGQHRIKAVIETGKTLPFLVARGLEEDAFNVIDTGKNRSAGDVLGANGVVAGASKSAIIKFVNGYRKGTYSIHKANKADSMDNQDVLDYYTKFQAAIDEAYATSVEVTNNFKGLKGRIAGGMFYVLAQKDHDVATAFFHRLATGIGLKGQDDPMFVLRKKLMEDVRARMKYPEKDRLAWIAVRRGKPIKQLRWKAEDEKFPEPF